jgi:hypothetical protein
MAAKLIKPAKHAGPGRGYKKTDDNISGFQCGSSADYLTARGDDRSKRGAPVEGYAP